MREFLEDLKKYITPVNMVIISMTIVCYIVQEIFDHIGGDNGFTYNLSLAWWLVFEEHQYYRLFTYMFLHGSLAHIFNNMLVLTYTGSMVERLIGGPKYLLCYISTGLVAGMTSAVYNRWCFNNASSYNGGLTYSLGASGAVFGIVGALFWIVLVNKGRVAGITMRQVIMFIVLSVYAGIVGTGIDNVAHIAGVLFGIISAIILYNRRGGYT